MIEIRSQAAFKDFASTLIRQPGKVMLPAFARLPEGLDMVFLGVPDGHMRRRWKLVLRREHFYPTAEEVEACCSVFKIPPSVVQRNKEGYVENEKSGRHMHVFVVELTWDERYGEEAANGDF